MRSQSYGGLDWTSGLDVDGCRHDDVLPVTATVIGQYPRQHGVGRRRLKQVVDGDR